MDLKDITYKVNGAIFEVNRILGPGFLEKVYPVKYLLIIMYYTYVLHSKKDNYFYTGFTENLKLRFEQHNKGLVESTKHRRPLSLVYYEACFNRNDATRREKYLKTYHGKVFLRRRLKSYLTG